MSRVVTTTLALVVMIVVGCAAVLLTQALFGPTPVIVDGLAFVAAVWWSPDLMEAIGRRYYGKDWPTSHNKQTGTQCN